MGLMCLALTLTNCQKAQIEEVNPSPEANFELFASPAVATDAAITRTTNDGLATKWATGDQINIFHAPAGLTTYTNDKAFTLKDAATGSFSGTVGALDGGSYDWYAFYPYTSQITTPANTSAGWVVVGGKTPQAQIQNGNNSRTHLSGGACPLFGIAKAVESSAVPSIEMNHLTSIIKVQVTNNSSEDLKVENVSFTGTEDIVGTYYINFAASPVGYKPSGNQYVSNTASLEVKNGEVISSGASADFYIAVKPFTAKTGTTLKLAVNGYEKPLKLTKDVSFTAGNIKKLKFDYDSNSKIELFNFADPQSLGLTKPSSGNGTEIKSPIVKGDITLKTTNGGTATRIYNSGGKCDLRVYKDGGSLTFSSVEGYVIKSMVFTGKAADNSLTVDSGSYSSLTWTGSAQSVKFTATATLNIISATITYEKGVTLPALATPAIEAEVQNNNSIYVLWGSIAGAKDYTVTCGTQSITLSGTEHTFTGLAYSTSYTISVVANPTDASVNAPSAAGTATATTGANPAGTTEKVLIIDAEKLTNTATTKEETYSFDGIDFIFSKGAKAQVSTSATNSFSNNASILIGKSGAYIYNKTAIPGVIKKFEIYANEGASTKVSVGVNFSASSISSYSATAQNTYKATLSTTNKVYDCSDKLPAGAKYFWYQVTNAYNSQVQFRITYVE